MNFTSDVKREIISRGISGGAAGRAALSAFVRTSGLLSVREGVPTFSIISETENVAEFFTALFEREFQEELSVARASVDRMSGRGKLIFELSGENSAEILYALGLVKRNGEFSRGIRKKTVSDRECALAYIKGAFLGGGSCILPSDGGRTGYHLEFVFPEQKPAEDFRDFRFSFRRGGGKRFEKVFAFGGKARRSQSEQSGGELFFGERG